MTSTHKYIEVTVTREQTATILLRVPIDFCGGKPLFSQLAEPVRRARNSIALDWETEFGIDISEVKEVPESKNYGQSAWDIATKSRVEISKPPHPMLERAQNPKVGDKFKRGDSEGCVVAVDLDSVVFSSRISTSEFSMANWRKAVRATLDCGSEFIPAENQITALEHSAMPPSDCLSRAIASEGGKSLGLGGG